MKWYFALIFLFFAEYNYAQNNHFEWVNPENSLRERIEINTQNHYKEVSPSVWKLARKLSTDVAIFKDLPPNFFSNYFYLDKGKNIWFTVAGSGLVYQFTPASQAFVRLDHTFYRGYNFGAYQFVRNNTLYSVGGEGFWTYNRALTFYDVYQKEWEVVRTDNFGPEIMLITGYHGYSPKADLIFSGGSFITNYIKDMQPKFKDRLFVFDFKTNIWKILGKINPILPYQKHPAVFWDGEHFIHFCVDKLYFIEPIANTIHEVEDRKQVFTATHGFNNFYTKGDTIFNYSTNGLKVVKFSKKEMFKKAKYVGAFYVDENDGLNTFLIVGLVVIILGLIIYFYARRQNKSNKSLAGIFESDEIKLLKCLIAPSEEDYLTNNDLNDVLGISEKSQENQRRIKMNLINGINKKIETKFNITDAISRKKISDDKRLVAYFIKPEVIEFLGKL